MTLTFTLLPEHLAIARLPATAETPQWAGGAFVSVTRTRDELSIVCSADGVPADVQTERNWRCLKLEGPFALTQTGVAAEFTSLLARAGVSVFVISTFDTDYVLVKQELLNKAVHALRRGLHIVNL